MLPRHYSGPTADSFPWVASRPPEPLDAGRSTNLPEYGFSARLEFISIGQVVQDRPGRAVPRRRPRFAGQPDVPGTDRTVYGRLAPKPATVDVPSTESGDRSEPATDMYNESYDW